MVVAYRSDRDLGLLYGNPFSVRAQGVFKAWQAIAFLGMGIEWIRLGDKPAALRPAVDDLQFQVGVWLGCARLFGGWIEPFESGSTKRLDKWCA